MRILQAGQIVSASQLGRSASADLWVRWLSLQFLHSRITVELLGVQRALLINGMLSLIVQLLITDFYKRSHSVVQARRL
jgi:hypothetical protein